MTYSRPGTRNVDAFADPGLPGQIAVRGDSRVEVSKNGDYLDFRSAAQIGENARQKYAAVNNFINTVTNAAPKVIKGVLMDQANQQIGELLATQNPDDLMRSTTAGPQRDAIRALNPFARDKLEELQGRYGASQYPEIYLAEYEKNKAILTSTSTSPERKAAVLGDIKETALQQSGLSGIAPGALAAVAPVLAEFEGKMSGRNYQDTVTTQRNEDFIVLENGIKSGLTGYLLREQQDMSGLTSWMTKAIASQSEMFTPNEFAAATYSGIATDVQQLIAEGNTDQAAALARGALALAKTDVKTPSGISFFDIKDSEGKSLLYKLSVLSDNAVKAQERAGELKGEILVGNYAIDYEQAQTAEEKAAVEASFRANLSSLEPQERAAAISGWGAVTRNLDSPTQLQIQNSAQAMIDISGLPKEQQQEELLKLFQSESITATQFAQRMAEVANGNPLKDIYDGIELGRRATQDEMSVNVLDLIDIGDIDPNGEGSSALSGLSDKDKDDIIRSDLSKRVNTALEKKAKEARDNGNPWTTEMYVEKYREELSLQAATMRKELSKGQAQGTTRLEKINTEYMALANNAKEGPLTVQSFAPQTVKRWRKNNPGKEPTVKALLGEMSRQMDALTDNKGQKIYPNAVKDMKDLARQSRLEEGGFWEKRPRSNPLNFLRWFPQLRDEDAIKGGDQTPEQKEDNKEEKTSQKTEVDEKDPEQGFQKVLMAGLGALGNVVTLPAKAGTLEGKPGVLNANNSPEFAKVMARREPFGIKTQPLPQLSATSSVRRVPIAIGSRDHPIFVAIGIAEGTRTPSGGNTKAYYGHTDPGDGNWNRGTVSGGRNGGSPQQVDRQWMATLTSVAATMAPVLQRLGLRPDSQGWNRVMFNILDLQVQSTPAAVRDFVGKLPQVMNQGLTIEAIAKARADSFFNPQTGRLEASGFGNNYSRLFADQRSRAGVYDYKRRF